MTAHHHLASPAAYSLAPSATGSPSKMAHHHRQHPGLSKFHRHSSSSPGGSHGRTKRGRNSSGWLVNQLPVIVLTATNMIIISMLYSDITCHMERPSLIDNNMATERGDQLRTNTNQQQQQQTTDNTVTLGEIAGTPPPVARRGFYAPTTPKEVLPIQQQQQQVQYMEGDVIQGGVMQGDVIQRLHARQQREGYLSAEALGVGELRGLGIQGKVVRSMAEFHSQDLDGPQDPRLVRQRAALGAYSDLGHGASRGQVISELPLRRGGDNGYWRRGYAEGALAGVQWGGGRGVGRGNDWQGQGEVARGEGVSGAAGGHEGGAVRVTRVKGATGDDAFDEDLGSVEFQEVTWQESSLPRVNGGRARAMGNQGVVSQRVGGLEDSVRTAWGEGNPLWRAQQRQRGARGWVQQEEDDSVSVRDAARRQYEGSLSGSGGVYQEGSMGEEGEWRGKTVGSLRGALSHRRLSHSLSRPQRMLEQAGEEWVAGGGGMAHMATARHARGLSWGGEERGEEAWAGDTWQARGGASATGVGSRLASVVQAGGGAEGVSTGVDSSAVASAGDSVTSTAMGASTPVTVASSAKQTETHSASSTSSTAAVATTAAAKSSASATPAGAADSSATSAATSAAGGAKEKRAAKDIKVSEESLWVEAERPLPSAASSQSSSASSQATTAATKAALATAASAAGGAKDTKKGKKEKEEVAAAKERGAVEGKKGAKKGGKEEGKKEESKEEEGKREEGKKGARKGGSKGQKEVKEEKGKAKGKGKAQMDPAAAAKAAQALFENLPEVKNGAENVEPAAEDNNGTVPEPVEINKDEFVLFSGYRSSSLAFVAIGLAPLNKLKPSDADTCWWQPRKGKKLQGQVMFKRPAWEILAASHKEAARKALAQAKGKGKGKASAAEMVEEQYEVEVLVCHLEEDSDMRTGGQLHMNVSGKDVFVYEEDPSPDRQLVFAAEEAVQFDLMMCSMPLVGKVDETRFMQWFDFHRNLHKVDYFQIYDAGGVHESLLKRLEPFINEGSVSVFDMRAAYKIYSGAVAKALVMNDCLYYARPAARWAMFMDFDEYLHVPQASHSIQAVLSKHKFASHITLGRMNFFADKCLAPEGAAPSAKVPTKTAEWDVEKMVFREPEVFCGNTTKYSNRNMCLEQEGQRKFLVNPRLTNLLSMNKILEPRAGGLNLDTSEARLYNYEGITYKDRKVCSRQVHSGDWVPAMWSRDYSMAEIAKKARASDSAKK